MMKSTLGLAVLLSTVCFSTATSPVGFADPAERSKSEMNPDSLYTCPWIPWCGDPEAYTPPEQPEDDQNSTSGDQVA